ncbi:Sedlin, N-terminal conserved region-domain-containing protein [Gymnopilus junonius]|uniref:Trafficking protein particle complex subunit 2-like protein n=1 Tax=Gymnopilus junonius TaxID=109634 RepID=A0A9P5P1A0_GYMJU|nr:Sedlin, N-terminal conserved region-domain-containing protein [Gymnopilus junonius]
MAPNLKLHAVAFISPQNQPILIRTFTRQDQQAIKYHYIAHTSLDVMEERVAGAGKAGDCYLGLLFSLEDAAVYGYITPLKVKVVLVLPMSDSVVRDAEIITIFKALHMAYYSSISNPFLKLNCAADSNSEQSLLLAVGGPKWKNFKHRVDEICRIVGQNANITASF